MRCRRRISRRSPSRSGTDRRSFRCAPAGIRDPQLDTGEVWTYRDPGSGDVALLLFSDAARKPASLPPGLALNSPGWLRAFLGVHEDEIATVYFDIAGPHPMQATPGDLIAALDA